MTVEEAKAIVLAKYPDIHMGVMTLAVGFGYVLGADGGMIELTSSDGDKPDQGAEDQCWINAAERIRAEEKQG